MINRGAILLRYKEPAIKWINEADSFPSRGLSLESVNEEQGKPLESGEKWLLSKWVRQLPTPYGREVVIVCPGRH